MQFGDKVRVLRAHHDMTQEALAVRAGIDRTTLSRIEAGIVRPEAPLEQAIREALGWDDEVGRALEELAEAAARKEQVP